LKKGEARIDFAPSPRPTIGVEWEFALVDAHTRDLSNEATSVIAEIGESPRVHKELLRNTVEVVTGVCDSAGEAIEDLRGTLGPARRIVRDRGMELFSAGTHPFARWSNQKLTDAPRYAELIKRTQWWGRQMLIWGVHVHVGISSANKVMPVMSSLLKYYPHMLALSASSPWWGGEDTGYASNRAMMLAAAHRRAAVSVSDLDGVRRLRPRPEEDRHHRPHQRDPLGHQAVAAPGHPGGAGVRRSVQFA